MEEICFSKVADRCVGKGGSASTEICVVPRLVSKERTRTCGTELTGKEKAASRSINREDIESSGFQGPAGPNAPGFVAKNREKFIIFAFCSPFEDCAPAWKDCQDRDKNVANR
jgi:hypothetical protein